MIDWFTNLANQFFALNCIFSQPMRNSYFVNVTEEVINAVEDAASQNCSSSVNSKQINNRIWKQLSHHTKKIVRVRRIVNYHS